MSQPQQLVPYWDAVNGRWIGPGNVVASVSDYTTFAHSKQPDRKTMRVFQAGNMAAATLVAGIAHKYGIIKYASVAVVTAATGNATSTVDFKVNGTSVLTGTLTVDSTVLAYTETDASLGTSLLVKPGDVITVVTTTTVGSGALPINLVYEVGIDELPMTGDTIPLGHAAHAATINGVLVSVPSIPTGNDTYSIDFLKNGTTVLTAPISITSSATAKTAIAGTLVASPTVAAGDYLEATVTYTHGTGGPAVLGIVAEIKVLQTA